MPRSVMHINHPKIYLRKILQLIYILDEAGKRHYTAVDLIYLEFGKMQILGLSSTWRMIWSQPNNGKIDYKPNACVQIWCLNQKLRSFPEGVKSTK